MPVTLICPSCCTQLTVSDHAPATLTCPNCLWRVNNPHAGATPPPLPVIPVEQQVHFDTRGATIAAIIFALLLLFAVGRLFFGGGPAISIVFAALFAVVIGALAVILFRQPAPAPAPPVHVAIDDTESRVLSYRSPAHEQHTSAGAFVGGFFAALGLCGLGVLILGSTVEGVPDNAHGPILISVIAGVIAYIFICIPLAARPGWRGFGRGTLIGMILGMLALGPCAFCYTMTI